jgi:hypothetical protein
MRDHLELVFIICITWRFIPNNRMFDVMWSWAGFGGRVLLVVWSPAGHSPIHIAASRPLPRVKRLSWLELLCLGPRT